MSTNQKTKEQDVSDEETSEKEIPPITVDETLDVEDRLPDNIIDKTLPSRYLKKGEDGNVIETPDEMFDRVADNVAKAEFDLGDSETAEERYIEWRGEFARQMKQQRFMPNSPTLMNAGARLQQLSACFVNSPEDNLESISETEKEWTLVQKTGGGMGGSFSDLRPAGTLISTTKGTSSGPVSFMRKYNLVAGVIKQGGVRRGAQMAELRADHPDIGRFVVCKRNEGDYDNFNISVAITDEFVDAVKNDESYTLYDPRSNFEEPFEIVAATREFYSPNYQNKGERSVHENLWRDYADTIDAWDWDEEETVSFRDKWEDYFASADDIGKFDDGKKMELPARFIWDLIIDGAWRNGEPGLFHLDETNRQHSFDVQSGEDSKYAIKATNPCAEQPLCEYESCNLGHINLSLVMEEGAQTFDEWVESTNYEYTTTQAEAYDYFEEAIDFDQLDTTIEAGTRFLDNVVTQSEFPLEEIEDKVSSMRKIGLGVMGWAQLCYQMGLRYGSDESLEMGRIVMNYIDRTATEISHELAEERGCFEAWDDSKYADPTEYADWFKSHAYELPSEHEEGYRMRNHNVTTVAPTGTTSMISDTSGGIEPVYEVANYKNVGDDIRGDDMYVEFDSVFLKALEESPNVDVEEVKEIAEEQMASGDFDGVDGLPVPEWMKNTFITTEDVSAEEHGLMQRAFQEGVDSGISKTVNLPKEATHADVHDAYMLSVSEDDLGSVIKGLTVYRDQSREKQVLTKQKHSDIELERYREALEESGYTVIEEDEE
jgi:adenosylcobalamin-dependent ribonucleoside-diphosphate reductase